MVFCRSAVVWIPGIALGWGCVMDDTGGADRVGSSGIGGSEPGAAVTSCLQESDCPSSLACVAGVCQACSRHGQCASDVCDRYAATTLGPGACIPEASVVYATASGGPGCNTGDGTRSDPACSIAAAIPHAVGIRYAVRAYAGHYFPFGISNRTVFIFGPADGTAVVGEEDSTRAVRIEQGARVVLDGLDLDVSVLTGVTIADSDVQLRDMTIRGDSRGIMASNSKLNIDRVRASGGFISALQVDGSGTYRITNSFFEGGFSRPVVVFTGPSTGSFLFNTVTGGDSETHPGGIDCGTTPRVIRDSIVVHNAPAASGAQTVGACIHRRVVVGSGDTRPDPGLIPIDPTLDDAGRLLDTTANSACCIDRGARFVPSLYTDFFGMPRPQGASNDIGAFERSWHFGAEIPTPREGYGAAAVDAMLYYIGGHGQAGDLAINEAHDPVTGLWSMRAPLPAASRAEMAAVSDGTFIYIIGGRNQGLASVLSELWRYEPAGDHWTQLASMPTARATEYMAAIDGRRIYVVGGRTTTAPGGGGELAILEIYDIDSGVWSTGPAMPEPRSDAVVLARDAHLYVFGGYGPSEVANEDKKDTTFIFDIANNTWSRGANLPPPRFTTELEPNGARVNLTGAVCNGRLHVIGGSGPVLRDSLNTNNWTYDPTTNRWREEEPLLRGTTEVQAVSTANRIFVVGGGVLGLGVFNSFNQIYNCRP